MVKQKKVIRSVSVGLVQMSMKSSKADNLKTAITKVKRCADVGAKIILLPELFTTEYFPKKAKQSAFKLAESIPGPTTDVLCELAAELNVVIIAPLFEKRAKGLFHNSSAVIDADGSLMGVYRKMHIPDDPGFYEKYYFAPGDLGFKTFKTKFADIGVLICWDQWYPEAARLTALSGAQILFYPTAIGWLANEPSHVRKNQLNAWKTIQVSHAIANGVYVVSANRVGMEGGTKFWGSSFIAGPDSDVLGELKQGEEKNLVRECDLSRIESFRQEWPFLRDRRIDAYKKIQSRFID